MASQQKQGKGRPSYKREATKRKNNAYGRQRNRTNNNIVSRLQRHYRKHPRDMVAKTRLDVRLSNASHYAVGNK